MSILRLLDGNGYIDSGEILFNGVDLTKLSINEMYKIRGNEISVSILFGIRGQQHGKPGRREALEFRYGLQSRQERFFVFERFTQCRALQDKSLSR